jgi:hypothetical protein
MRHTAIGDATRRARRVRRRTLSIAAIALAVVLVQHRPAAAQRCEVPVLNDNVCGTISSSIEGYKDCYRKLYDKSIIPTFRYLACSSHNEYNGLFSSILESVSADVTGAVYAALADMELALADPEGPVACLQGLNDVAQGLEPFIAAERGATDLDVFRRSQYSLGHLVGFTDVVLAARQNRARCGASLTRIRQLLVVLGELKAQHLDYCRVLQDSVPYTNSAGLRDAALKEKIDPQIDLREYFEVVISINSSCGSFGPGGSGREAPCATLTSEYQQTVLDLDGTLLGWLSENQATISLVAGLVAGAVIGAEKGSEAGGIWGGVIGAAVGLIISGVQYVMVQHEINELHELISEKQQELLRAIDGEFITPSEFAALRDERCHAWRPVIDQRVEDALGEFDAQQHIAQIDAYFALSDKLHGWYNELFLWATTPGPDGHRFIDQLAEQDLLVQREQFDQRNFRARSLQEMAAQKNLLVNAKAIVTQMDCTDVSPSQRRMLLTRLRGGLAGYDVVSCPLMESLAVLTKEPIPFTSTAQISDVQCAYKGYRSDVASLEVRAGVGFGTDMVVRDTSGAVIAELRNVTSDTTPVDIALAGFVCTSKLGRPFGLDADTRLAAGTYPLLFDDNTYGFSSTEAAQLRSFVKDADEKLRFKAIVCNRQLGTTIDLPRTADACGIPVTF